jgi:hypothetical protein
VLLWNNKTLNVKTEKRKPPASQKKQTQKKQKKS